MKYGKLFHILTMEQNEYFRILNYKAVFKKKHEKFSQLMVYFF